MQQELKLFAEKNGDEHWSQTLELFDSLPKFNYHRVSKTKEPRILNRVCEHRGKSYKVAIIPALIEDKEGQTWAAMPGKREELVMHCLRYLSVQEKASLVASTNLPNQTNQKTSSETAHVKIVFNIHQLREELKRVGHGYNWNEIEESLLVLSRSIIKIECGGFWSEGSILESLYGADNKKGSRCVAFHPLASQAILSGASRKIRYDKYMSLKKPLSRWLYIKMCHNVTNAEQPTGFKKGIGLRFSYLEVFNQSGLQELKDRRNNVRTIRQALEELKEAKILNDGSIMGESWVEKADYSSWEAFPSNQTVSDIMEANKGNNTKPHEKLSIS